MSTFKKLLALTLALAMVLSVSAFAGYKADTYKDAASIDEDCEDAVELLYALDIMVGSNDEFRPTANITRAEIAKMIYVILNYGKDDKAVNYTGASLFSDVEKGSWYEGYVNYCATIKIIQGDGNGKFHPLDNVTTAAAAKMLLTALNYSAEDRGYVGANWEKNVLSDANIVGLLSGYNYSTTGYAPRQWIAVMFYNALVDCYCIDEMRPTVGLITSANSYSYSTLGAKYYDLYVDTVYAYATNKAYIDQVEYKNEAGTSKKTTYADKNYVLFSDGNQFKGTGLGAMDLGQKYRVIARDNVALSVRPVKSVVADATVAEITYDYSYSAGSSTREFTIGDMTAPFTSSKIKAISNIPADEGAMYASFTEQNLISKLDKQCYDTVRAIDKDGDGEIEYIIIVYSDYAYVSKSATDKSGDYVKLTYTDGTTSNKLWLDDTVASEDELVAGNYVKRTWNMDTRLYDLEVLDVIHDVKYTNKKGVSEPVYTIGDEQYQLATKGFTTVSNMPAKNSKVSVVYDGDLAVYVGKYVFTYTDIEDIYNQLAVFTESFSMNSSVKPNRNVTGVAYYDMVPELIEMEFAGKSAQLGADDANAYHLFAADTDEDGAYLTYLKGLESDIADVRAALSADEDLIGSFKTGKGTLNGKNDSFAFENGRSSKFDEDARFFVISKSGSKIVVEVLTIADIEEKSFSNIYAELLYSPADSNGRVTIVGGLLDMRTRTYGSASDLFFITDKDNKVEAVKDSDKETIGYTLEVSVVFSDNTDGDVDLFYSTEKAAKAAMNNIKLNALYGYTYDGDKHTYTLGELKEKENFDFNETTFVDPDEGKWEIVIDDLTDFGEIVINNGTKSSKGTDMTLSYDEDTVIALTIKHFSNNAGHELMDVDHIFTDLAGWEEALGEYSIVNGKVVETGESKVESFTCYTDVANYNDGELLNIVIYADDYWFYD